MRRQVSRPRGERSDLADAYIHPLTIRTVADSIKLLIECQWFFRISFCKFTFETEYGWQCGFGQLWRRPRAVAQKSEARRARAATRKSIENIPQPAWRAAVESLEKARSGKASVSRFIT